MRDMALKCQVERGWRKHRSMTKETRQRRIAALLRSVGVRFVFVAAQTTAHHGQSEQDPTRDMAKAIARALSTRLAVVGGPRNRHCQ